ncbi:MAG: type II pantothenate kinase [Clostridia bacterium]|nr:type II pantothenate kinase [Clostridia bacterium]
MRTNANKTRNVIGIDVGGSTTKIVGFKMDDNGENQLISPFLVRATDPITSIYGAFGKFIAENNLSLEDIDRIMITGVGSTYMQKPIYSLDCKTVPEFSAAGIGGLYLSGLDEAIVVSMGTGTALIHAKKEGIETKINYLGGTGVGGGTLLGLTKKMTGIDTVEHIEEICSGGDLANIDLRVGDISKNAKFTGINENLTASNFGKLSDMASNSDIALGVANMVAETIAMMAVFTARGHGIKNVVLIGNLTTIKPVRDVFENLASFGINFIIPENASFGTVIGAALYGKSN